MKRLRPFFPFYGSKWMMTPRYPTPEYDRICEPFAGSASYSLLYPDKKVHLVDQDPVIAGLWDFLIHAKESEILSLPATFDHVDSVVACQEAKWLLGFWCSPASSTPKKTPSKWGTKLIDQGQRNNVWYGRSGEAARHRIASQLQYIRHWRVRHGSYADLRNPGRCTYFVDPPYEKAGKHYRHGSDQIDYTQLGHWCTKRRGQVIVCENTGATWLPFDHLHDARTARNDLRPTSKEAVWLGGTR